ncbi:MAG: decarboxylating 6-phosphogluconate dehydrogenase [Chlorobium sp.]|nr:decarboxylating 6-phosphogluconate dehydrogenase [Chlorobium phaeovibrioides]NQU45700.1 decarboxylating 6-phosphogluconate dehydrogenase [Chlorobium sp.]
MQAGFIGLGKMGYNMALQLLEHGHELVVFDLSEEAVSRMEEAGAIPADSVALLASRLSPPRVIWLMVPAGDAVDATIRDLLPQLQQGDIVIDGGNSRYQDSRRRAEELAGGGIGFLDVGTSGGLEGARHGACTMVGGEKEAYLAIEPLLRDLCVPDGYGYMGSSGAGHYAKMVHNGIEYGMMQAIGEGFELMQAGEFGFDMEEVSKVWANGSVIRSWLMELARQAFQKDGSLGYLDGAIADSGEGRWTVEAALERDVSVPVIASALFRRYRSRSDNNFSDRVVAALRHEFGGHGFHPPQ